MLIDIMTSAFIPSKLSCVYLVKISEIRKNIPGNEISIDR